MLAYGIDPSDYVVINVIYLLTNFFILTALAIFAVLQFSKWNYVVNSCYGRIQWFKFNYFGT